MELYHKICELSSVIGIKFAFLRKNIIKNVESETTNTARNEVSENVINENIKTEETENVIEDIGIGSDLTIIANENNMENINGIWISEEARECVLNIVNKFLYL